MIEALLASLIGLSGDPPTTPVRGPLELVEVRSPALQSRRAAVAGLSMVDAAQITDLAPTHPSELFASVPGAWVVRGSGQEHLTAIRSPVLTGPGACGAFLVLEDRVPVRPAGFCNVNELFEVNLLQARAVNVLSGPGSVIYGSNALHGVLDVSSGEPADQPGVDAALEAGSHAFFRARAAVLGQSAALRAQFTRSESFRDDEKYEHGFVNAVWATSYRTASVRSQLSLADLDQGTAGFIIGQAAYRDPALRKQNLNPEAFRKADALRLTSRWAWAGQDHRLELTPYLRSSDMEFLQHFLPGKPLERNGQDSTGLQSSVTLGDHWALGADLEYAEGYLVESQEGPTQGSDFLQETRPPGYHYDYLVQSVMLAAWAQFLHQLTDHITVSAGARWESLSYEYTNRMLDGNTRDDGSECGFGGCLYSRPADRRDHFVNLAPELGLSWSPHPSLALRARMARGFRIPQATELYRLQRGQSVADLATETLDTFELGASGSSPDGRLRWDLTGFSMRKRHAIFRDANGFNVSDGSTSHRGAEAALDWRPGRHWQLRANASYARHRYTFQRAASGILDGNAVDTAPEWLAGAQLRYEPVSGTWAAFEWVHQGGYFLEPANAHRYPGHDLLHLRVATRWPGAGHRLTLRVTNLLDRYYADRADFAFGNYRYFPGAGRQVYLQWSYQG
jgi:outer membrane receptor protein involved in Fe transport